MRNSVPRARRRADLDAAAQRVDRGAHRVEADAAAGDAGDASRRSMSPGSKIASSASASSSRRPALALHALDVDPAPVVGDR